MKQEPTLNIVQFKMKFVEDIAGKNIDILFTGGGGQVEQHSPVHVEGKVRLRCAYCALMSRMRRTRYQCAGCGPPLCSIGNVRVQVDRFTIAHETEERLEIVCKKHDSMRKRDIRQKK
jgi:DDE_Tnp_1-like zinc-ribbon